MNENYPELSYPIWYMYQFFINRSVGGVRRCLTDKFLPPHYTISMLNVAICRVYSFLGRVIEILRRLDNRDSSMSETPYPQTASRTCHYSAKQQFRTASRRMVFGEVLAHAFRFWKMRLAVDRVPHEAVPVIL